MFKPALSSSAQLIATIVVAFGLFTPQKVQAACNYDDAELYNGWGWDSVAQQSCAPVELLIDAGQCEDHGGYPWGWNSIERESCRLDQVDEVVATLPGECVDTAPEGDGWGWDGASSCNITAEVDIYRCDDLGNYPWGWNPTNSTSCRLDLVDISHIDGAWVINHRQLQNVPLECRKTRKLDNQGRDILSDDGNIFFSTRLTNVSGGYTFIGGNDDVLSQVSEEFSVEVPPWFLIRSFSVQVNSNGSYIIHGRDGDYYYPSDTGQSEVSIWCVGPSSFNGIGY